MTELSFKVADSASYLMLGEYTSMASSSANPVPWPKLIEFVPALSDALKTMLSHPGRHYKMSNFTLDLTPGVHTLIVGPSASGKATTLQALTADAESAVWTGRPGDSSAHCSSSAGGTPWNRALQVRRSRCRRCQMLTANVCRKRKSSLRRCGPTPQSFPSRRTLICRGSQYLPAEHLSPLFV